MAKIRYKDLFQGIINLGDKMLGKIIDLSNKYEKEIINLRRKIHENPELSNEEYETSKLVEKELIKIGLEVKRLGDTGLVGILNGKNKGKTLLLRADMDALPIEEENKLEFKSKNTGIMHACGHDVHTANLIGVAKILNDIKDKFDGRIKFLFQPAEERGAGARDMIKLGVLENPKVDFSMGLHIMPIKKGEVLINHGNITAYSDGFKLNIKGKKAHTRKPEEGIDAINIAAHIIVSLNSLMSKMISPFSNSTFSIGKINGGTATNIVADYVELKGMMRSLDKDSRNIVKAKIESISKDIAKTFGGECEFIFNPGYPSVYNEKYMTEKISNIFEENFLNFIKDIDRDIYNEKGPKNYIRKDASPIMAAEDFGFISQRVPSLYYMIGTGDYAPGHSSKFFVDEKWIKFCTRTMVLGALEILK